MKLKCILYALLYMSLQSSIAFSSNHSSLPTNDRVQKIIDSTFANPPVSQKYIPAMLTEIMLLYPHVQTVTVYDSIYMKHQEKWIPVILPKLLKRQQDEPKDSKPTQAKNPLDDNLEQRCLLYQKAITTVSECSQIDRMLRQQSRAHCDETL